jgi:hypothetical protein
MPKQITIHGVQYPYITVTSGMSGYFAVMIHWGQLDPQDKPEDGFPEPYDTGLGRYHVQQVAIAEGVAWARDEGIPFVSPKPAPDLVDTGKTIGDLFREKGFTVFDLGSIEDGLVGHESDKDPDDRPF